MKSWTSPTVTPLPASGLPVRLHDTRSREIREVEPLTPGTARVYVCGITPYDATHMGHAATYVAADLMRRALLDSGLAVETAQNVTDVDDPLLERADRDGITWQDLAADQSALFSSDMEALRVVAPETYRSVSDAMTEIIAVAARLAETGHAYPVATPDAEGEDLYLDLSRTGTLGDVCGWTREQMMEVFAERGGDPERPGKRDPFDPLLWRAAREGEPSWEAGALGRGRPGWHIECVCIAEEGLGLPFDVQTGGRDLIFPHHDMSASHAAALGSGFATLYPHTGMVGYEGEKMSKSKGNLVFVSRLVAGGTDPMAIRLVLMAHHYRADWEWTDAELTRAEERLAAYRSAASRDAAAGISSADVVEELRAALRDDLDTPRAVTALDDWATRTEPSVAGPEDGRPGDVGAALDALFGIDLRAV